MVNIDTKGTITKNCLNQKEIVAKAAFCHITIFFAA